MACPRNKERYAELFDGPELPMDEDDPGEGPHPRIMSYTVSPLYLLKARSVGVTGMGGINDELGELQVLLQYPGGQTIATENGQMGLALPPGYKPSINKIGSPSEKVFAFEGGRFWVNGLNNGRGGLDYTTSTNTTGFSGSPQGNFASMGPYFAGSGPSGMGGLARDQNGAPADHFEELFLRHSNNQMNLVYFDGRAEMHGEREIADPSLYTPAGSSVMRNIDLVGEFAERFPEGSKIR